MLKNKKGVEMALGKIIAFLLVLALLVWAFFYFGGLKDTIGAIAERFLG